MAKTKIHFKVEGMDGLIKSLNKLGSVPQKHVTSSAKKGMNIVLKQARANAPYDTGALTKGIKLKGEKSRYKGKKVYRVIFDETMNHIFVKEYGNGKRAYYPVLQEYGYFTKNGRYIPGFRFIRDSLIDNTKNMENIIIVDMKAKIDAEIEKAGLK